MAYWCDDNRLLIAKDPLEVREDREVIRCGVWQGDELAVYAVHPCGKVVLTHHSDHWAVPAWNPEDDAMTTETPAAAGYDLCQPGTQKAVSVRRIGSLPLAVALGMPDIGEALLESGDRVLITWGRRLNAEEQHWFAHNSLYQPIWCGDATGGCELVLGCVFNGNEVDEWVWGGLRLTQYAEPVWRNV